MLQLCLQWKTWTNNYFFPNFWHRRVCFYLPGTRSAWPRLRASPSRLTRTTSTTSSATEKRAQTVTGRGRHGTVRPTGSVITWSTHDGGPPTPSKEGCPRPSIKTVSYLHKKHPRPLFFFRNVLESFGPFAKLRENASSYITNCCPMFRPRRIAHWTYRFQTKKTSLNLQ